ncbi:MAG: MOSC domain-containing protein [Gemmataceae bacterium]
MKLRHGAFDDASVSVISLATIAGIGRDVGVELDRRRFRANILLEAHDREAFHEDGWVGGTLVFGTSEPRAAVSVTARDVRCMMINLDPDTATQDARVMKAVVRLNANNAGVYGTVVQTGTIRIGDPVTLLSDARR